jgi:hypothetical protein
VRALLQRRGALFVLALLAGCAAAPPMPDPPPTHPASPLAQEVTPQPSGTTLTMPARTAKTTSAPGGDARMRGH